MEKKISKLYKKINNDNVKIVIFGLSYCGYTEEAIKFLKKKKIPYKYYIIDKYYTIFLEMLTKIGKENENLEIDLNHKTFPIIFLNKKFLGGYNELVNLS